MAVRVWITLEQSLVGLLSEMEGMASPIYKINLDKSKFGTNLEAGPKLTNMWQR